MEGPSTPFREFQSLVDYAQMLHVAAVLLLPLGSFREVARVLREAVNALLLPLGSFRFVALFTSF